jgi:hypothetical protein
MHKWEYEHVELVDRADGTLHGLATSLQQATETQVEWDLAWDQVDNLLGTYGQWGWELVAIATARTHRGVRRACLQATGRRLQRGN